MKCLCPFIFSLPIYSVFENKRAEMIFILFEKGLLMFSVSFETKQARIFRMWYL